MVWYRSKKSKEQSDQNKTCQIDKKVQEMNKTLEESELSDSLKDNKETIKSLFVNTENLIIRDIQNKNDKQPRYFIAFCDGVTNSAIMNENLVKPLILSDIKCESGSLIDVLMNQVVFINEVKKTSKTKEIVESMTYGDTILFADGEKEALILNTKGFKTRSVEEPDNEKILLGPREGFTESMLTNISLIQRKLRTNDLKLKYYNFGKRSNTKACICYLEGLVDHQILDELYRRLSKVDIDAVLDVNYIVELINEEKLTPFRTMGYTERPDVVVGKILEGRIAIILDGSPSVLTLPYLFIENFQSSEDYYLNFLYTSFSRMVRILGFILTVTVPALYLGVVAFHREMLPAPLLISIAGERANVPLPAGVEVIIMLIVFDILKETGVRMPTGVGQALSIVGALVIGQAAVDAKLVASPMIIVVALTGITSLLVPKLNAPIIYLRFFLLVCAGVFGLYGFILGLACILIHIVNLRTFGIVSASSSKIFHFQTMKDLLFRAPWWKMKTRPRFAEDRIRMNYSGGDENE